MLGVLQLYSTSRLDLFRKGEYHYDFRPFVGDILFVVNVYGVIYLCVNVKSRIGFQKGISLRGQ